jgi:actin-related protein 5
MAANVFMTGSLANLSGMRDRLVSDLRKVRPAGDPVVVTVAADPANDAWRGARDFAAEKAGSAECFISREEYFERGAEYLKEHECSNRFFSTPPADELADA